MPDPEAQSESPNPLDLHIGPDDWCPTPHGAFLGEIITQSGVAKGKDILELGGGVGNHTIALLRSGARSIVTTEITAALSATTRANVARHLPDATIEYRVADWLNTAGRFDLLVTNPPFAKSGQRNRRYFIDSLILDSHRRLRPGGNLMFIQSSMADIQKTLRRLEENGYEAQVIADRSGPFRDYYFEDPSFLEESKKVPGGFEIRDDGTHIETLYVVYAKLLPWTPHEFAHLPDQRDESSF